MKGLHVPPNKLRIDEIYAFISVDPEGNEGVCAFQSKGMMVPMVAADLKMVEHLKPVAKQLAAISPYPIKLVKFSTRTEVEVINK
jgi:hypothetical protein